MAEQWYYAKGGQQHGPVNGERLKQLVATGQLQSSDLVWREGMAAWAQASTVPGISPPAPPLGPPPLPPSEMSQPGSQPEQVPSPPGPAPVPWTNAASDAAELGSPMLLAEKIEYFKADFSKRGINEYVAAPPPWRLAWKLGFDVPPPYFWAFSQLVLYGGGQLAIVGVVIAGIAETLFGWSPGDVLVSIVVLFPITAILVGVPFGLCVAPYYRHTARKLNLPPWDEYPHGRRPVTSILRTHTVRFPGKKNLFDTDETNKFFRGKGEMQVAASTITFVGKSVWALSFSSTRTITLSLNDIGSAAADGKKIKFFYRQHGKLYPFVFQAMSNAEAVAVVAALPKGDLSEIEQTKAERADFARIQRIAFLKSIVWLMAVVMCGLMIWARWNNLNAGMDSTKAGTAKDGTLKVGTITKGVTKKQADKLPEAAGDPEGGSSSTAPSSTVEDRQTDASQNETKSDGTFTPTLSNAPGNTQASSDTPSGGIAGKRTGIEASGNPTAKRKLPQFQVTKEELKGMSLPQMKTRFGDPDEFHRSTLRPNVFSMAWNSGDDTYILVTGVQAIDGSGLYHILSAAIDRPRYIVDKFGPEGLDQVVRKNVKTEK